MVIAYGNFGAGILFLLILFAVGMATLLWCLMWACFGFRARVPQSFQGGAKRVRSGAIASLMLALATMVAFPPMRSAGIWEGYVAGRSATSVRYEADRNYFGYIPQYRPFSELNRTTLEPSNVHNWIGFETGRLRLKGRTLRVDLLAASVQLLVLLMVAAPFLLAKDRKEV
ncbi:hypothetical protein AB1L30_09660 [Bremerella sp. JC817]|uniref:hypothetical protein n=1 Tax=Bremerella sp. JC817 TaxID=3231756 RepID=UPI003459D007